MDEPLPDDPALLRHLWLMDDDRVNAMLSTCANCKANISEDAMGYGNGNKFYCSTNCYKIGTGEEFTFDWSDL